MKSPDPDIDPFIEALRGDLPSGEDEARVRARLLATGVVLTSVATTSSVAAGSMGPAATLPAHLAPAGLVKVGLFGKVLALPLAGKIGVATTLAVAVAATSVPLVEELRDPAPRAAQTSRMPAPQRASNAPASAPREGSSPRARPSELPSMPVEPSLVRPLPVEPSPVRPSPREPAAAEVHRPSLRRATPQGARGEEQPGAAATTAPAAWPSQAGAARVAPAKATPQRATPPSESSAAARSREASPEVRSVTRDVARDVTPGVAPDAAEALGNRPEPASTLREETRLMEQAILALNRGDRAGAAHWLSEHGRRFPVGLLTRERERAFGQLRESNRASGAREP